MPEARTHRVQGILGDADNVSRNDLTSHDGKQVDPDRPAYDPLYHTFGDSWRISQGESLFDYASGTSTDTFTDPTFPDRIVTTDDLTSEQHARAEAACATYGVTTTAAHDDCLLDVGLTGDPEFAGGATTEQKILGGNGAEDIGRLEVGQPDLITFTNAGSAVRAIAATEGQRLSIRVEDNSLAAGRIVLRSPSGAVVGGGAVTGASAFFDPVRAQATGTFTLEVQGGGPGSLSVSVSSVPANEGATSLGTLTPLTLTTPGEVGVRTFSASAGEKVGLDVSGNTIGAIGVSLLGPNGAVLLQGTVGGASKSFDPVALPSSGAYSLVIDPQGTATGAVNALLSNVPGNPGQVTIGEPVTVTIATVGENATRTFTASAGQLLTAEVSDSTIADTNFTITAPDGRIVSSGFVSPPGRFFDTFSLPADGTYTVTIDPRDKDTGRLTFALHPAPASPLQPAGTRAGGAAAIPRLRVGRAIKIDVAADRPRVLTFSSSARAAVAVLIGRNTVRAVRLTLLAPGGRVVGGGWVRGPERFFDPVMLPASGEYRLVLAPAAGSGGHLTLAVSRVPADVRRLTLGQSRPVELRVAGQTPTRRFAAHAGRRLRVIARESRLAPASILVRRSAGRRVAVLRIRRAHDARSSGAEVLTTPRLPRTGTYEAVLDADGPQTGSLRLSVRELPARRTQSNVALEHPRLSRAAQPAIRRLPPSFRPRRGQRSATGVGGGRAPRGRRHTARRPASPTSTAALAPPPTVRLAQANPLTQAIGTLLRGPAALAPAAARRVHSLSLHDADLLANDVPGPVAERDQTLSVTKVASTATTHGTLTRSNDGSIAYTPEDGFIGIAQFTYEACDNGTTDGRPDPLCATAAVSILVVPDQPPTLTDRHAATNEDSPVDVELAGTDPEGDPVSYTIDRLPAGGTVSGTGPIFTYTPSGDFHGADAFTVVASDGQAESEPATVGVTVAEINDPPRPAADTLTARPGKPLTLRGADLLRNDTPGPENESAQTLSLSAVDPGTSAHGTITRAPDGTITYLADAAYEGTASFRYTTCDDGTTAGRPDPRCADGHVTVHVAPNAAPSATPQTVNAGQGRATPVALSGADPEGEALTFTVTAQPTHGHLSGAAPALTYTSEAGFTGTDSFTFTASDGTSTSGPAAVTLLVSGGTPPITAPDAATVAPGSSVLIDVLANDTAGDVPLDPARLRIDGTPAKGTATVADGQVRYAPAAATTSGRDTFTYQACDTHAICATGTVTVTITTDTAPETKPDSYEVEMGKDLAVNAPGVLGNDPGRDGAVHATLGQGVHAGQLLLQGTGAFTYTPDPSFTGTDTFTYAAVSRTGQRSAPTLVSLKVSRGGLIAADDDYSTQRNTPIKLSAPGVLANDDDTHATQPQLSATVVRRPQHGDLTLLRDGTMDYTPEPGFIGDDSFTYTATNLAAVESPPARVALHITAPVAPQPTLGNARPADGARITEPVPVSADVKAADGDAIARWSVTARDLDGGLPFTLASGTGAPPRTMATFDPTRLRNNVYELRIQAVSTKGETGTLTSTAMVAGNMKLGDYSTTYDDMDVTLGGVPVQIQRTYDTKDRRSGEIGFGWHVDLSSYRATPNGRLGQGGWTASASGFPFAQYRFSSSVPHYVTVTAPDGSMQVFDFVPAPSSPLLGLTVPDFVPRPRTGTTAKLEDDDSPVLAMTGGSMRGFLTGETYDPQRFRLTERDGTVVVIDRFKGLRSVTDRNGNDITITDTGIRAGGGDGGIDIARDGAGRITALNGPTGNVAYTYSNAGDLAAVAYPNGATQAFTYDDHNLKTFSGGGRLVRTLHYDDHGRLTGVTDGNGHTATITTDVEGHQQGMTDATGALTTVTTYDDGGNPVKQDQTFRGRTVTTKATFDPFGRQLTTTDPLGHTIKATYDAAGNVLTETDEEGNTTTFTYNALGQPLTATDALGHSSSNKYDQYGNLLTQTAPNGGVTRYTYNAAGGRLTQTDPAGRVTTYTYDVSGNLAGITDPAGHVAKVTVDPASGRVTSVTNGVGATTKFAYDADGNQTKVTDANGHTRSATFDSFDRVTSRTDPSGATTHYGYDGAGNLTSVADRNGDVTKLDYDADSRLIGKTIPGGDTSTYAYDPLGRLDSAANSSARLAFTYDDAGNLLTAKSTGTATSPQPTVNFAYGYNAARKRTTLRTTDGTTTYHYDADQRLSTLTDPKGGTFAFKYDPTGRMLAASRPNGIDDSITYNTAGDLTSLRSTLGRALLNQADYTYNAAGQRATFTTKAGTTVFGYDAASRLISATHPASSGLPEETYTYDGVGNRTSASPGSPALFTYDSHDRLLADGTADYTYDKEGNLRTRALRASRETTRYGWSAEHQLTSITYPNGSKATVRYDPLGRRIEIGDGTHATRYAYDQNSIAAEYDAANHLTASYVDGTLPSTILEMLRGGRRYFYLTDAASSTTALTDTSGAVVNSYAYGAFGTETQTGAIPNPFRFTGQPFNAESGLVLFPLRAYDPSSGRFLSEDPLPSSHRYAYVANDPVNNLDPSGGQAEEEYNNTVYIAREEQGCYVGISKNFFAREAAHGARFEHGLTPLIGGLSKSQAFGLESYIMSVFGGPGAGGLLTNLIYSTALTPEAVAAAEEVLEANAWIQDFLSAGCA